MGIKGISSFANVDFECIYLCDHFVDFLTARYNANSANPINAKYMAKRIIRHSSILIPSFNPNLSMIMSPVVDVTVLLGPVLMYS